MDPRESASYIASLSTHVKVSQSGVDNAVDHIIAAIEAGEAPEFGDVSVLWRSSHVVPDADDELLANWSFLIDTLNFSFWTASDTPYTVGSYSGYTAMVNAIKMALEAGIPIATPSFYKDITIEKLGEILNPNGLNNPPLMGDRVANLQQAGTLLCKEYGGSITNVIKEANGSAVALVKLIARLFPSFNDIAFYKGRTVSFMKRSQILAADLWACFGGKGLGYFRDIDQITMFADYRVPQILKAWGVIEYSTELYNSLESIEKGSEYECEIRGSSIEGVEQVVKRLSSKIGTTVNAIRIDFFLWNFTKKNHEAISTVPIHKTRTVFY